MEGYGGRRVVEYIPTAGARALSEKENKIKHQAASSFEGKGHNNDFIIQYSPE